jgi:hypothetical protein
MAMFLSPVELREQMKKEIKDSSELQPIGFDNHYFLVLERQGGSLAVTPLTSHPTGDGWAAVEGKRGHPGWTDRSTYFNTREPWPITVDAAIAAARVGGDLSGRLSRNFVTGKELDRIVGSMIRWQQARSSWGGIRSLGLLPQNLDHVWIERAWWQMFWARYRTGEIWRELRLSSVFFRPPRVRFVTGRA